MQINNLQKTDRFPTVSVITVCLNDPIGVRRTIESVLSQTYLSVEFLLIDGGSGKETQDILAEYVHCFDKYFSESDNGIYDAMNKGLINSSGAWYIMMNSGDIFQSPSVISDCMEKILEHPDVAWAGGGSKVDFGSRSTIYFSDDEKGVFHHQSLFIKKEIHKKYGLYINSRASNAWDFFFFNLLSNEKFLKLDSVVSICDGQGVSSTVKNYLHVTTISFLFGQSGRIETALKLLLYPLYRSMRNICESIGRFIRRK